MERSLYLRYRRGKKRRRDGKGKIGGWFYVTLRLGGGGKEREVEEQYSPLVLTKERPRERGSEGKERER